MTRWTAAVACAVAIAALAGCTPAASDSRGEVLPEQLVGTWMIDETFDAPEQPFIAFADDGTWTASDGCNRVQGTWELGLEGALATTSGPSTLMACEGAQLPLAVTFADFVIVADDDLSLYSSAESTVTTLVRSDDPEIGELGLPVGQWVESDAAGAPTLSLAADGSLSGNDGCNVLSGTWELADDGALAFGPIASTRRFCEGVDTWLSLAHHARIRGGTMTIEDEDGTTLGQLSRP